VVAIATLALVAACGPAEVSRGINDPYEDHNRAIHAFNKASDQSVVRDLSVAYGENVPEPVQEGVGNVAANLGLPGAIVNNLLQLRIENALNNTARFVLNTTFGLGGILDPAASLGLVERETDFGETLHVWGLPEGHYVELPLLGPSTQRDTLGLVVDFALDPINRIVPSPERYWGTASKVANGLGTRYRFKSTVDSILYDSADSYAQARLLYLEQRRFQLQGPSEPEYFDPYEDLYGE